jgi:hypothetical protein
VRKIRRYNITVEDRIAVNGAAKRQSQVTIHLRLS